MPQKYIDSLERDLDYFIQEYSITASISKILVKCIENIDRIDKEDVLQFAHQMDESLQYLKGRLTKIHQGISNEQEKTAILANREHISQSS
ncbi:MAG: hypothetical protein KHX03_06180 [Clostridium sp.]|nr:hypothetical protein [Clostridium sp.]